MDTNGHESGSRYSDSDANRSGEVKRLRAAHLAGESLSDFPKFVFIGVYSWFFDFSI
jgi:hypothetical protein